MVPDKWVRTFDLFRAFDWIESSHKSDFLFREDLFFFMRAQHTSNLPSNISTMMWDGTSLCQSRALMDAN